MEKRDYYEILGIPRDAHERDVKKVYRQVAMECHPDRNPGDKAAEDRFKAASEAYEVLSDQNKRKIYDTYGHRGLDGAGFHGFERVDDIFGAFGDIFGDLFGEMGFGPRRAGQPRAQRGADRQAVLTLSFEEAAHGVEKEVTGERVVACAACHGSGAKAGTGRQRCAACGGTGQITARQGFFMLQTACAQCRGEGSFIVDRCVDCQGNGRVRQQRKLQVKVPAGIDDGMHLILRGEGDCGAHGGPAGDLYVVVQVAPHARFRRDGDDVHCVVEITFPQAAMGTRLTVPTLYGNRDIKVAAGTDSGTVIRLKGEGVRNVRSRHKGDQLVEVRVGTPKKLSRRQRQLLEEFMKTTDE